MPVAPVVAHDSTVQVSGTPHGFAAASANDRRRAPPPPPPLLKPLRPPPLLTLLPPRPSRPPLSTPPPPSPSPLLWLLRPVRATTGSTTPSRGAARSRFAKWAAAALVEAAGGGGAGGSICGTRRNSAPPPTAPSGGWCPDHPRTERGGGMQQPATGAPWLDGTTDRPRLGVHHNRATAKAAAAPVAGRVVACPGWRQGTWREDCTPPTGAAAIRP